MEGIKRGQGQRLTILTSGSKKRLPIPEEIRSLESVYSISYGKKKGVF